MKLQQKPWVTRGTSVSTDAAVQEERGLAPRMCLLFTPFLKLCKAIPKCHCLSTAAIAQGRCLTGLAAQVTPSYSGFDTSQIRAEFALSLTGQ